MNTNLIITQAKVVELAFSGRETISADSIRLSKIDVAQEYFLRPVLGDALFEKVVEGEHTLFTENFLQPALAHYVRYGVIGELSIQVGDNGAVVYQSEKADNTSNNSKESLESQDQKVDRSESQDSSTTLNRDSKQNGLTNSESESTDNTNQKRSQGTTLEQTSTQTTQQTSNRLISEQSEIDDTSTKNIYAEMDVTTSSGSTAAESGDKLTGTGSKSDTMSHEQEITTIDDTVARKTGSTQAENMVTELLKDQGSESKTVEIVQNTGDTKQVTTNDSQQSQISRTILHAATDFQRQVIMQRALFDANVLMAKAMRYIKSNPSQFPTYVSMGGAGFGLGRIVL